MDPTEALNRIRHAIERYREALRAANDFADAGNPERHEFYWELMDEASEEAIGHFEDLDGWLSSGGFIPTAWQSGDPDAPNRCGRCGEAP